MLQKPAGSVHLSATLAALGKAIVLHDHQQLWAEQLHCVKGVKFCYLLGLKIAEVNLSLQLCFSK